MKKNSKSNSLFFNLFIALALPLSAVDYKKEILEEGLPIVNSTDEKDILPGAFRTSNVMRLPQSPKINFEGLDTLNISGSSQFSELSLDAIIKRVGKRKITIVNLRQEDGGFLEPKEGKGAISFSYLMSMPWWTGENPKGNRTTEEIEKDEEKKMADILKKRTFTVYGAGDSYAPSDNHRILHKMDVAVKRAFTEKTLAKEKGLGYFRLPDKKFGNMEFEHVDAFVNFVKKVPKDEWLHFHCKKGQSRTTLFMTMYDMMRNAGAVSAEDIIQRQGPLGIGGADLMELPDPDEWDYSFKKQWREFLFQFHQYAKENKDGFQKSWSKWAQERGITPPDTVLLDDYTAPTVQSFLPESEEFGINLGKKTTYVLNTLNESKLGLSNFRTTQDIWVDEENFNSKGLRDIRMSGSSQYSKEALRIFMKKIRPYASKVVVVDLRHDDHVFVNGLNVSTFESKDALLKPRSPEEISASEKKLTDEIKTQKAISVHGIDTKYPKNSFDDRFQLALAPETVETPEEVVKSFGAEYLLIGSKRFSEVSDADVDRFIDYSKSMPEDTWYHFHCKKGKSRTTFFMAIFDMMKNADSVSMQEIVQRQKAIGGVDLLDITPKDPTWSSERESKKQWIVFLERFHQYAKENKPLGFAKSWTQWSEEHADFQPNVDQLVVDRTIDLPKQDLGYSLKP
jgi:predicted protein tyrosine phosphatase